MLGFTSLSLLCWQRTIRGGGWRWYLALGVSFALALSTHYYTVLLVAALAVGEGACALYRRRLPWAFMGTAAASSLVFVAWLPLIRSAQSYSKTYWAQPEFRALVDAYRDLVEPLAIPALVAITALVAWHTAFPASDGPDPREAIPNREDAPAIAAIGALAVVLVMAYLLAQVTGAFVMRYGIETAVGLAALAGLVVAMAERHSRRAVTLVAIVLTLAAVARTLPGVRLVAAPPATAIPPLARAALASSSEPIVVTGEVTFLPLWHYAATADKARVVYVCRPETVVRRGLSDSGDRILRDVARLVPITVYRWEPFLASHTHFLVFGPPSDTWLLQQLVQEGARLVLVAEDEQMWLYRATLPGGESR